MIPGRHPGAIIGSWQGKPIVALADCTGLTTNAQFVGYVVGVANDGNPIVAVDCQACIGCPFTVCVTNGIVPLSGATVTFNGQSLVTVLGTNGQACVQFRMAEPANVFLSVTHPNYQGVIWSGFVTCGQQIQIITDDGGGPDPL